MDMQALVDNLNNQARKERALSQMTIGELLGRLSELNSDLLIEGLGDPHSYRGYYSDLALERISKSVSVEVLSETVGEVLGTELTGYKSGEFLMDEDTPVWVSSYGSCGKKLMAINDDGSLELEDDE